MKTYYLGAGESCETCGRVPEHGETVYVVPIGGGYAFWCAEHVESERNPVADSGYYARVSRFPYVAFLSGIGGQS